jgi:hypothetical protein
MGLVVTFTFAICLWVVIFSLGHRSFDGFFLALIIIVVGAGTRILLNRFRGDDQTR